MMLTRAFLGAEPVDHVGISVPKNQVGMRVEQVFRTKNSIYIHYTMENRSKDPIMSALQPPTVMLSQCQWDFDSLHWAPSVGLADNPQTGRHEADCMANRSCRKRTPGRFDRASPRVEWLTIRQDLKSAGSGADRV